MAQYDKLLLTHLLVRDQAAETLTMSKKKKPDASSTRARTSAKKGYKDVLRQLQVELGPVNTNDHVSELLHGLKSPTRITA